MERGLRNHGRVPSDATTTRFVTYLLERGLGGLGPLSSAEALAAHYREDPRYGDDDARVDALIRRETRKNFATGFVTGLGGFATMPVAIPSALGASWVLQARLAGAIARLYGHDLASERVRTAILLSLAGDVARDAMRDLALLTRGNPLEEASRAPIPGRAMVEVNKRIGQRLLTSFGRRGGSRAVPLVGGVVGGAFDAVVCRMVGRTAKAMFRPAPRPRHVRALRRFNA